MTITNVDDLVAKLNQRLVALGNGKDRKSDNDKALWYAEHRSISSVITGLRNPDTAKPERQLAELTEERTLVIEKQEAIEEEIADEVVSPSNHVEDRQQLLRRQLAMLHAGALLRAPGVTFARLTDLDERIAQLNEKLDKLRARHEAFIGQAEALLARGVTPGPLGEPVTPSIGVAPSTTGAHPQQQDCRRNEN
jgi:hypothetical protein